VGHKGVTAASTTGRLHLARAFLRDIRSPEWGIAGQGFRFALAGTFVAGVYVGVTTLLHSLFGVPFQIALAIGFVVSVCFHFTLQRLFVWRHRERFALGVSHQALRYLLMCGTQYGITALSTSQLPDLLSLPVEVVYVATMLALAGLNFLIFRGRVFHPGSGAPEQQVRRG
jgi:putative flippase GtrA